MAKRRNHKQLEAFPWGEHKGQPIDDIPAAYLLDLYLKDWLRKWPTIRDWIEANLASLEEEAVDVDASKGTVDTGEPISYEDYLKERKPYL